MTRTASPEEGKPQGAERAYGLKERVPWTTSRIKGTPEPPAPYRTEPAFPGLKFEEPLAMAFAPGSDRVFVAQRYGKVYSFPNDPSADRAELVFDLKKQILGLTFHPRFEEDGTFFLAYILEPSKDPSPAEDRPRKMRVSRFRVDRDDPPRCDPATERVVIEWPSLWHDGCCLAFGKDGCLYISAGDGGGPDNGQDLGDLSSSILRIDVDHPEGGKPYAIPRDNPFVGLAGARPEVWAYGLRQPWRFSFDRATGDLWAGDVGQDLWEMVHLDPARRQLRLERHGGEPPVSARPEDGADPHPAADRRAQPRRVPLDHRRLRLPRHAAGGTGRRVHLRRLRHRQDLGAALRRPERRLAPRRSPTRTSARPPSARTPRASSTWSTTWGAGSTAWPRPRRRRARRASRAS